MKVSLKWLAEYVEFPTDTQAFCDKLDLTGTGVEGVDVVGATFDHVVVGSVLAKDQHPDSDHMWVCRVDVGMANRGENGEPEPLQIVCGAQNFSEGDKIVVAMVGAAFGDFKIKKSKLRGVVSCGMNCSERELGLGGDHDGIMILPADAPVGMPFADYKKLADKVLDLEITPNRPDCLSMEGMAREVGAMYRTDVADVCGGVTLNEDASQQTADLVDVSVEDAQLCPRYTVRVIKGVKVGPSPDWLVERIAAAGSRSINNVVDITNYVLFLLGQPLHAFDLNTLVGDGGKAHIVVRAAKDGETLTTLDGEKRDLTSDMTVIATREKAVALAGVMGGIETEVSDSTVDILLETATFSSAHTSRTSRNLGLISESSMRYERTVDAERIQRNADFAAALIADICGGTVCAGLVDEYLTQAQPAVLSVRLPRMRTMLGGNISTDETIDILQRLGCTVSATSEDTLEVVAPTFRPDLEREIDLYEEVLRLYGMEKIEPTLPGGRGRIGKRSQTEKVMATLHNTLAACGMNETMTYSFADPSDMQKLRMSAGEAEAVELINPINADQSVMRQSIIPGLLRSVAYNQSHSTPNIQLYEMGNVFTTTEGRKLPHERMKLAGVLAGAMAASGWNTQPAAFDFFDGKGILESIARELALPKVRFKAIEADDASFLQPGRAAQLMAGGSVIGWVGEIHPLAVAEFEATAPVVAFELDVKALVQAARPARDYVEVPQFPPVSMDVAFVVDEDVTNERLVQCMSSAGGKLLSNVHLFDVFRDEARLGEGKKSLAYALEYRAADRTLTGEEVDKAQEKLIKKVCGATGAEVRG